MQVAGGEVEHYGAAWHVICQLAILNDLGDAYDGCQGSRKVRTEALH